jgi:dTDP-4-dehydrorhamnose reductase
MKMKVLITGKNGQVGNCLVEQLSQLPNVLFLALDRVELDITNEGHVNQIVTEFKPDVIINAAAYTAVDKAEVDADSAFSINRDGPRFLAMAAENINAAMLHISTDYVFSGDKVGIYNEADKTNAQSVYGESKLAGELAVQAACTKHIILRTAWVFGETGNNFVKTMLNLAKTHDTLGIVGDQYGAPTYAGDIASTLITMANTIYHGDNSKFGIYHFSGLPHVNWNQFSHAILNEALKQKIIKKLPSINSITTADYPTPAKRPANSKLDIALIQRRFTVEASDWKKALLNLKQYID